MSTIAKGEITLSPVNDAYTVLITPASCTITADFDGSNPHLDNAKGTITVKRGTLEVPFKITGIAKSSDTITVLYSDEQATTMPFAITQVGNTILNGYVDFNLKTDDGFNYTTQIRFSFSIVRESTMLDWIQDWEGSKTKIGGTYIMTPKLFVGKKEDVIAEVNGVPTWNVGALTGVYIGPDLLSSGTSSVGIYGYLKDAEIFHINADGGYIGGWTFNAAGLQSANGVVHILSEGTIYAQNPNSTTPYWGIYADGHAIFANGNVKFQADGSAEFAGMITSKSGTIGGWHITTNQLYSNRFIIDSKDGFLGINATKLQVLNSTTNDLIFPDTPDGGLKLWYTAINDFGMAAWSSGKKVFQLGSINQIAGWNFNHQAIWSGGSVPALTQGAYTDSVDSLTVASNGIRSYKWYVDSNGTAAFVGGLVKFNTGNAEMFGWLMRQGRFSAKHAALISEEQNAGLYVSVADISEISGSSLRNTISNNGGIYIYSDGANSIMRAYDTNGNLGFYLSTSGYNTIGKWSFNHESIYTGSQNIDDHGFTRDANAMILGINGLIGNMWKLLADGSGAVAGGNISWDKDGNVTFTDKVSVSWSSITNGPNLTKIDANGIYTGTISANDISAGTISTASIKCEGKWELNTDGSGFLASQAISWTKDGVMSIKSGTIGGFIIGEYCIGAKNELDYEGISNAEFGNLIIQRDFFRVGAQNGYAMFGDDVIPASAGRAFTAVGRIVNKQPNYSGNYGFDQANYGLFIDVTGGTKNYGVSSNAALMAPSFIATKGQVLAFDSSGTYKVDVSQLNTILLYAPTDTNMTLPPESSIASQFGFKTLPDDFCATITIVLYNGSKTVILKNIHNGSGVKDYPLSLEGYVFNRQTINFNPVKMYVDEIAPSSITLLVTKIGGFRYQVLSYASTNSVHV